VDRRKNAPRPKKCHIVREFRQRAKSASEYCRNARRGARCRLPLSEARAFAGTLPVTLAARQFCDNPPMLAEVQIDF